MNPQVTLEFLHRLGYGPAPESPKPADKWLQDHGRTFGHFIGGKWCDPVKGDRFETVNPANGKVLATVAQGSSADVDAAVQAAAKAFPAWSQLPGHERAKFLYAIARAIARWSRTLAVLETMNNGKPVRESRDTDVPLVIRHLYHHAGWAEVLETEFPDHYPKGVVSAVIPWNFPELMLTWKVAPVLASGNTIVLKPAETTPLTALFFAQICQDVGLPPGVVNIVTGDGETGKALVVHPTPWKLAFTGSTEVGRWIRKATAGSGKHLTMELGGKSACVVFADADLDSVVESVVNSIWFNQGQVCCAASRLLVEESVCDELVRRLKRRMQSLRVGDPLDKCTDIGAVNSAAQFDKITGLIAQGKADGAEVYQPEGCCCPQGGFFIPPTLCTNVTPSSLLAQVEIFGPVLVVMSFRTPDEAVALANNTVYGLAACVWTENVNTAVDMAARVDAGTVWVNCANVFDANAPFGGNRQSGFGREGGREGMLEMLEEREETHAPSSPALCPDQVPTADDEAPGTTAWMFKALESGNPDRTLRLLVGGKLARPDGGTSFVVNDSTGKLMGTLPDGNRKDLRNAVEAARGAVSSWGSSSAHLRAQILYFLAENLAANKQRFARNVRLETGCTWVQAICEVEESIARLFYWAGWADKFGGEVKPVIGRFHVTANYEPVGVVGVRAPDDSPLLGFVSTVAPLLAMGNAVVAVAGKKAFTALDLVQLVQCSDVPSGVLNVLCASDPDSLTKVLASHMDVEGLWYFGSAEGSKMVEESSACNMKRTFVNHGKPIDWHGRSALSKRWLHEATRVKTIWLPFGA